MTLTHLTKLPSALYESGPQSISQAVVNGNMLPIDPRRLLLSASFAHYLDPRFVAQNLVLSEFEVGCFYVPTLVAIASCFQLLPASQYSHHSRAGGLLDHSLQTGCQMMVDPNLEAVFLRGDNRHPTKIATVRSSIKAFGLAVGALHDHGKIHEDMIIQSTTAANVEGALEYRANSFDLQDVPLVSWLCENNIGGYSVRFREGREIGRHSKGAFQAAHSQLKLLGIPLTREMERVLVHQEGYEFERVLEVLKSADEQSVQRDQQGRSGSSLIAPQLTNALVYLNSKGMLGDIRAVNGRVFLSRAVIEQAVSALPKWDDFADVHCPKSFAHYLMTASVAEPPPDGQVYFDQEGVEGVIIPLHTGLAYALLTKQSYPSTGDRAEINIGELDMLCRSVSQAQPKAKNKRLARFIRHLHAYIEAGGEVTSDEHTLTFPIEPVLRTFEEKAPRVRTVQGDLAAEGMLAGQSSGHVTIRATLASLKKWLQQ